MESMVAIHIGLVVVDRDPQTMASGAWGRCGMAIPQPCYQAREPDHQDAPGVCGKYNKMSRGVNRAQGGD